MADFSRRVHCLLGLPVDFTTLADAAATLRQAAATGRRCFLSTPNLNFLMGCLEDADFRDSILHSDLVVADGMPLVWIARLLGIPLPERVAGSELFQALERGAPPLKVYFFGGPPGAAEAACHRLEQGGGGLVGAGHAYPGFVSLDAMSDAATLAAIDASGADFVVVALGAKKGQAWIERNRRRLAAPIVSHLGAVVNFAAGSLRQAPPWMRRSGLEWLWRIREEPQLWRRYWRDGLGLLRLLATRVLPLAWQGRRPPPYAAPVLTLEPGAVTTLRLAGTWTEADLAPLRRACADAVRPGADIVVDLAAATWMDSACLGLLLLLRGALDEAGGRLRVSHPAPPLRRLFELSCADFLLAAPAAAGADFPFEVTAMKPIKTALIVAGLMCATSIAAVVARPDMKAAEHGPTIVLERMIPAAFGDWRLEPQAGAQVVNPQTQQLLDKLYSQVLTRNYVNAEGYRIMLSIAYGNDQRDEFQAHKPEVCYPAQGFALHSNHAGVLATDFGGIPVRRLFTSMGQRVEPVTYWFTVGDKAIENKLYKRIVELRYSLSGQIPDGILFRVSSIDGDEERAYRAQESFIRALLRAMPAADRQRLSGLGEQGGA